MLIVGLVFGFFFGLGLVLNTHAAVRVVESGSMCVPYGRNCDGWRSLSNPFAPTIHKGDIIIVQGVDPKTLNTNYPNSDIIIYKKPTDPTDTPIVHRIVNSYEVNGTLYFQTKGDGNDTPWPAPVATGEYDCNSNVWASGKAAWPAGQGVPADLVEGKVILRIPYVGWLTLIFTSYPWIVPLIAASIVLALAMQFIVPAVKRKRNDSTNG